MSTELDTDIFKCYRCMEEWELYTYLVKYETRKCNLCHRPICRKCMKNEKNKRLCLICELHPARRACWRCGWISTAFGYKRLINLHRHLHIQHPSDYKKKYYKHMRDKYYNT